MLGFVGALSGCANYTLIRFNVDVGSLMGDQALKTTIPFTIPELSIDKTIPDKPEGQLLNNFPKLDVLNSVNLEFLAQTSADITGGVSIYVAPGSETNVYQDNLYLVSQTGAAATKSVQVKFAFAPLGATPTPEQQRQASALTAIKSGNFRVGLKIKGTFSSPQNELEINLKTFKIGISGYPTKLIPAN